MEKTMSADQEMNQSTGTATSAALDCPTPATSPLALHSMPSAMPSAMSSAMISARDKFHEELCQKHANFMALLKEMCAQVSESVDLGSEADAFEWRRILEISEGIFNEYAKSLEGFTREFDQLNRDFVIWQEAAYILDSEKVAKRLGAQERWINWKESFLQYTNEELLKSASLIDDAIKKLNHDK